MEELARLRERVNELLKRYAAVVRENENLYKEQERLHVEITKLKSICQDSDLSQLSKSITESMSDEARQKSRNLLDEVIREIDQILVTLDA